MNILHRTSLFLHIRDMAELEKFAKAEGFSTSSLVREAIKQYLNKIARQTATTAISAK